MKEQLRKQYKQIRQQLSQEQVVQCSNQIASALFQTSFWKNSKVIMLYLSFQNEIGTHAIYQQGWTEGKTMLVPICSPQTTTMQMSCISSLQHLVINQYGIRELPLEAQQIISPNQIDLCLIPGIAFDLAGNRLGFGAGYYDRYLPKVNPQAKRIALAYECQISPTKLPVTTYDLPMDYILTEKNLYQIENI